MFKCKSCQKGLLATQHDGDRLLTTLKCINDSCSEKEWLTVYDPKMALFMSHKNPD